MVGYGTVVPDGRLVVFSVDTEAEAKTLIAASCPLGFKGGYIAPELAEEQTLENLRKFSDRLQTVWDRLQARRQSCASRTPPPVDD